MDEPKHVVPTLTELLFSYHRIKIIGIGSSFITNLDGVLLLIMLVGSYLDCTNYVDWFRDICAPLYLAYQVIIPIALGFLTDITQDYSLGVMRFCSLIYLITDSMLYFLPLNFPQIEIFQSPYFVLILFMIRQTGITQVSNCSGKILKMKLDMDNVEEESQIAIFNHVGILCDGVARILLIITFMTLWLTINIFEADIGFLWIKSVLFIFSFVVDFVSIAFSFSIPVEYFMRPESTNLNQSYNEISTNGSINSGRILENENDSSRVEQAEFTSTPFEEQNLLINSSLYNNNSYTMGPEYNDIHNNFNNDIMNDDEEVKETETDLDHPQSLFEYFRDFFIVIWTHHDGFLRDVNVHLILASIVYGFVTIILQFTVVPIQHGSDFRNGLCGGQLMGIFILNIVSHSIFLFGAILYQFVFVKMRPYYFFSRIYLAMTVVVIASLCIKYVNNVPPFLTSLLYALTGLVSYWSQAYDSFLAFAITPPDYVGIVGVIPSVGNSIIGLLTIGYSLFNLADWITITFLNGVAVFVALYTLLICFMHKKAIVLLDDEEVVKQPKNLYTRFILGYN